MELFAVYDPNGKRFLPRVCWRCQGIELEPHVVQERNEYFSFLRKKEEAALIKLEKEQAARNLELGILPADTSALSGKKRKKAEPVPQVEYEARPSRSSAKKARTIVSYAEEEDPGAADDDAAEEVPDDGDDEPFRA